MDRLSGPRLHRKVLAGNRTTCRSWQPIVLMLDLYGIAPKHEVAVEYKDCMVDPEDRSIVSYPL